MLVTYAEAAAVEDTTAWQQRRRRRQCQQQQQDWPGEEQGSSAGRRKVGRGQLQPGWSPPHHALCARPDTTQPSHLRSRQINLLPWPRFSSPSEPAPGTVAQQERRGARRVAPGVRCRATISRASQSRGNRAHVASRLPSGNRLSTLY